MTSGRATAGIQRVGGLPRELGDFFEHWLRLSPDGLIPTLKAFLDHPDPVFQPFTAIIDVTGIASMEVRLFGTGLEEALGKDLTHATAMQWFTDRTRDQMTDLNARMLAAPCGLGCLRTYDTSKSRRIKIASLSLPLRREGVAVDSLVVFLVFAGMLERGELAVSLLEVSDARWIDIGYGVPEKPAEYHVEQTRRRGAPFGRRLIALAGTYLAYLKRLRSQANIAGLLAGTGDAELNGFFDHWQSLRGGRMVPRLSDFLDHPHPHYQPHVTIIDLDPLGRSSVRLMGGERHDLGARPHAGIESMRVVYSPRLFPKLHAVSQECVNRPCGFRAQRTFDAGDGRQHRGAVITLPLAVEDGKTRTFIHFQHLLGTKTYRGAAQVVTAIHNPQWIDIGAGVPKEFEP